jgi:DNA mismatch endonuclease (patch repair protein)
MDRLSKEKRSWNMSRIRNRNTGPERAVRSALHKLGYRFRLNRKDVPGKPDIVLPKYRTAIYIHGCFWHRHQGCPLAYNPKTNIDFWQSKFARNVQRDSEVAAALGSSGWKQLVIWECEVKDPTRLSSKLGKALHN